MVLLFRETAKEIVKDLQRLSATFRMEVGSFIKERPVYFYQVWLDDCVLFVSNDKTDCVVMHKNRNHSFIKFSANELLELPEEEEDEHNEHEL